MRYRLTAGVLLACALMSRGGVAAQPATQPTAEPFSVQVTVICDDGHVAQSLSSALRQELKQEGYLLHGNPWPMMRLFVYAAQTVNNRKNPDGWSIGVAHAYFEPMLAAAFHLMKGKPPVFPGGATGQLAMMLLHSQGTLTYLSVTNLDHLDDKMIPLVAGNIINTFSERWPPQGPKGPKPKPLPQIQ